jgi:hypothetical protein
MPRSQNPSGLRDLYCRGVSGKGPQGRSTCGVRESSRGIYQGEGDNGRRAGMAIPEHVRPISSQKSALLIRGEVTRCVEQLTRSPHGVKSRVVVPEGLSQVGECRFSARSTPADSDQPAAGCTGTVNKCEGAYVRVAQRCELEHGRWNDAGRCPFQCVRDSWSIASSSLVTRLSNCSTTARTGSGVLRSMPALWSSGMGWSLPPDFSRVR